MVRCWHGRISIDKWKHIIGLISTCGPHHKRVTKLSKLFFIQFYRFSALSLTFVFLNLFLFFNLNFLKNSIKTDKVVIDTSEIIDSNEEMMNTDKTLAFHYSDLFIFAEAPLESHLKRLYDRKKENEILSSRVFLLRRKFLNKKQLNHFCFLVL